MRPFIVVQLALLGAAAACGSAKAGTAGTTDGGSPGTTDGDAFAYTSRQQVRCYSKIMEDGESTVIAACEGVDDLPLSGSCAPISGLNAGLVLTVNGAYGWGSDSVGPAEWHCEWAEAGGGLAVPVPGARATMCCVVKSQ